MSPDIVALIGITWVGAVVNCALGYGFSSLTVPVALLFYTKAVTVLGATRGSIFGGLVPCIASVLGIFVLCEVPSTLEVVGVILASAGMIYVFGYRK